MSELVLEMQKINKHFGGVKALTDTDLNLYKGEVLGLLGENGAGKSTLMKVLVGAIHRDSGLVRMDDENLDFDLTGQALKKGIGIIYQELSIFLDLTVSQNIFINQEIKKTHFGILSQKKMNEKSVRILREELDINLNPDMLARDLSLGQRQLLEIARVLCQKKKIIIMDEPTAALEDKERDCLFKVVNKLKRNGTSVIFITHHLEEVLEICDRVCILRDGSTVGEFNIEELDKKVIIQHMIGKSIKNQYPKTKAVIGDPLLQLYNLNKVRKYQNISFELKAGEIVGLAGLEGCGKSEILHSIFGIQDYDSGAIILKGKTLKIKTIQQAIDKGIAFLPAERKTEGLFGINSIKWNITLAKLIKDKQKIINNVKENEVVNKYIDMLKIKVADQQQVVTSLSGGNQQKVMLARWLMTEPEIVLLEEPTRGIDVNAKTEVYRLMNEIVKNGKSICFVSSDGPELLSMSDRILVVTEGEISAELNPENITEQELTHFITKSRRGNNNE